MTLPHAPRRRLSHHHRESTHAEPATVAPLTSKQASTCDGDGADGAHTAFVVVKHTTLERSRLWLCMATVAMTLSVLIAYASLTDRSSEWIGTTIPSHVTESQLSAHEENTHDDASAFIAWFQAQGGRVSDKISIASFGDMGCGIVSHAPIDEHEELLFVPLDLIVCRETIWHHASKKLRSKYEKLHDTPTELLTAFVLLEQFKDASSRWYPYLKILPRYPTDVGSEASPLFYESNTDVAELHDERMIHAATLERRQAKLAFQRFRRLFKSVLPADANVAALLEKRYLWARFLINSRAFSIRGNRYLVPFGDVFNGKPQPNVGPTRSNGNGAHFLEYHRLQAGVGMEIRADRSLVAAGHQVFEDYGDNDNYVYFLYHGFLMAESPFDCAVARLPTPTDRLAARRILHEHLSGDSESTLVCITPQGNVRTSQDQQAVQLHASARAIEDDYLDVLCAKRENYALCLNYATDAEQDALLAEAIHLQLQAFPTTLEEDTVLLADETVGSARRHAIQFRISRKKILLAALSTLEEKKRQLRETPRIDSSDLMEPSPTDLPMVERMHRFTRWIDLLAFPIIHIELKYVSPSMGYGAFATKALDKDEIYLRVPTDVVLNVRSAVRSPLIRDLLTRHASLRWTESHLLVLHLLHEKYAPSHASRWRPYLDILPDHDRLASPLFFAHDGRELALLDEAVPLDLSRLVREYRSRVDTDYGVLERNVPDLPPWITLERFRWATAILDSRSIWWSSTRHLVPLLDMVNCMELSHDHAPHATRLAVDDPSAADTRASWRFEKGDHVVENYAQPNYIYLLYHGFVLVENAHDCAHFHFELDQARRMRPQDTDRTDVIAIMETMQLYSWSQDLCVSGQQPSLEKLMRVSLIAQSPQKAAEVQRRSKGKLTSDHTEAATREITERLDRLDIAIKNHTSRGERGLEPIVTYIHQQRTLMAHVLQQLTSYPSSPS